MSQYLVALFVIFLCATTLSQSKDNLLSAKAPELKIRVVPSKETYASHEKVFTKTEFTNLTSMTLCFPEPGQTEEVEASGYLITRLEHPADGSEKENFREHFSGGVAWPREKLLEEIERRWIKLAPNAVYSTKSVDQDVDLAAEGQWRFLQFYRPPDCSYNVAKCREYFVSTVEGTGCALPRIGVSSEPVTVTVVPRQKK